MQTTKHSGRPVISQTENNTTLWIGHIHADPNDHQAGQTFACPGDGVINNIQVYSAAVQQPGDVALTLHEFDSETKTWGPAIANSTVFLQNSDVARWIRFYLQPVEIKKNAMYGFRLQTDTALVGIGEAASHAKKPFVYGQEWKSDAGNERGKFFQYFNLAFKVEMIA
jgi:hypothetical protein